MKKLFLIVFYAAGVVAIGMVYSMWSKVSDTPREDVMNDISAIRQELREVRQEMERMSGIVVRQQGLMAKVEGMLSLKGSGALDEPAAAVPESAPATGNKHRAENKMVAALAEGVATALKDTNVLANIKSAESVVKPVVSAVTAAVSKPAPVAPPASRGDDGRKTLVFGTTSTGSYVKEIAEAPVVEERSKSDSEPTAPAGEDTTNFPDFSALVSTTTIRKAETEAATPGAPEPPAAPIVQHTTAGTNVQPTPAPVTTQAAKTAVVRTTNAAPAVLKRVTSTPATTAPAEAEVLPVRKSRVARQGQEAGSAYLLSISDQMIKSGSAKRKTTMSDAFEKDTKEEMAPTTNAPAAEDIAQ